MAKLEKKIEGNFDNILNKIEKGILEGSISATLEDSSDFVIGKSKCSVRVFERYSAICHWRQRHTPIYARRDILQQRRTRPE